MKRCREVTETDIGAVDSRKEVMAYQSSGVGAVNAEQGNGRADFLGRGGIGAQTHEGRARGGELLGGTQAGAGDTSGHHRELRVRRASEGGGDEES